MLTLDGSRGGGQILRTALSLPLVTGKPFRMTDIRGKRPKPGLKRQHLTCVQAALEIGDGSADGVELNSRELVFHPGSLHADAHHHHHLVKKKILSFIETLARQLRSYNLSASCGHSFASCERG